MKKADDWFGLFSEQAANLYGSDFYLDANGREVEVTCLGVDESEYNWPDTVVRGRLSRWVRYGRTNTVPLRSKSAEHPGRNRKPEGEQR